MSELAGARQVILVTSRWKGKDDIITLAWQMQTSFVPELYAISVGVTRYSNQLIKKGKCFCINFMPASLKKKIIYCGSVHGDKHDKFSGAGLEKAECEKINCARINEAIAYVECKLIKTIETGDHTIFVGKAVKSEEIKKDKRLVQIEGDKFVEA